MYDRIRVALDSPDWFRRGLDFLIAALLFRLPPALRRWIFRGTSHHCPICDSQLRGFLSLHRPSFSWCPVCRSLQRHRLNWLLFERQIIPQHTVRQLLHLAPEPGLVTRFRQLAQRLYVSADLFDPHAQVRLNLEQIAFAPEAFDLIYCSHMLEHIPDDRAAMRELLRTLAPGGVAVILVPILGERTFEDPSITDPRERERAYGQFDHVRMYGMDIIERLRSVGFAVRVLTIGQIAAPDEIVRCGLTDEGPILICTRADQRCSVSSSSAASSSAAIRDSLSAGVFERR
jgi:predicted SAM-dependent methyltransferase